MVRARTPKDALCCIDNRSVARAATEVPAEGLNNVLPRSLASVVVKGKQRHHKTRSAKAALRCVALDHGTLYRVPGFTVFQILDTDQLFAMQAAKGCDAGVERFVAESVFRGPGSYHGAGTAVAGSAALLGATQTAVLAQILEDCGVGGDIL
jgi:hypothetical protein